MEYIGQLINDVEAADARAALYYVSRYVKQASYFEEYSKDIFEEEFQSAPSESVRQLALVIIKAIEEREGMKASDLTGDRVIALLNGITSLERDLGPDFSDAEMAAAAAFAANIGTPRIDE